MVVCGGNEPCWEETQLLQNRWGQDGIYVGGICLSSAHFKFNAFSKLLDDLPSRRGGVSFVIVTEFRQVRNASRTYFFGVCGEWGSVFSYSF